MKVQLEVQLCMSENGSSVQRLMIKQVGGLSIGLALFVAPLSNYLAKRYHFKVPMIIGIILFSGGQICAAFTTEMWQLFLTQGVVSPHSAYQIRIA